jgi:NADH-quinone oxidoreductase subunit K
MTATVAEPALLLASVLFAVGLLGVLVRRNLLFLLIGVEIMLNAAGLAFVAAAALRGEPDGQVMFLFVLAVAAAEVAVGLALVLRLKRQRDSLDPDRLNGREG